MNTNELRDLGEEELQNELLSTLKELFNLKMQKASGQIEKPHLMRRVRRKIARIKTLKTERMGNANG